MTKLTEALQAIQNLGLDKIRCNLTGAPYAQLDSREIAIALQAEIDDAPSITVERLVDNWELKALTFNNNTLPSLRAVKKTALLAMIQAGNDGNVKVVTYLLTRLLFPKIGSEQLDSDYAKERMLFATQTYDEVSTWEPMMLAGLVQRFVVVDAYCAMPYWHTLWAFESTFSKYNLAKAPKSVRESFRDPISILEDVKRIESLISWMYELMLYVTERDGVAGKSGNKLAQEMMLVAVPSLPKIVIPHFQKTLSEADRLRLEARRKLDSRPELRMAYSATHGKSRLASGKAISKEGVILGDAVEINQMAKALADGLAAKKAKAAPKPSEPKEKKSTAKIDPRFAAAFNKLMGNG